MSVEPTKDGKKFVKTAEKTFRLVEQWNFFNILDRFL